MDDVANQLTEMDARLAAGDFVLVQISPGQPFQLRGTNVQVFIEGGGIVRLAYRVIPEAKPVIKPTVVKEKPSEPKASN